jgi:hypothetical protein
MPTNTYTPLATITLGSAASSVTFSSIPATYRDLVLVFDGPVNGGGPALQVNGQTTNYSSVWGGANDAGSVTSGTTSGTTMLGAVAGSDSGKRTVQIWQLMDYSATDKHKTVLGRNNANNGTQVYMTASRWASTTAITSVTAAIGANTFNTGSTFSLYGVIA